MDAQRHVVRRSDGGWEVRERADSPALSRHARRRQAVDRAREILSLSGGGELVVHAEGGEVTARIAIASGHEPAPDVAYPTGGRSARGAPRGSAHRLDLRVRI